MGNEWSLQDSEQILRETGCCEAEIRRFLSAADAENPEVQLRLLRDLRRKQLERLHAEEKKLDELDFLRYQLEKQQSTQPTAMKKTRGRSVIPYE
nr:hypothetical protein [uncultured Oscillibacter sp.]